MSVLSLSAENLDSRGYKNGIWSGIILLIQSWRTFFWKASSYFHLPACLVFSSLFRRIISHFIEAVCGYMPADSAIMISRLLISHPSQTEEVQSGWVNCKVGEKLGGLAGAQGRVVSGLKSNWQLAKCFLGLIMGLILFSIFRPRHQKRMQPVFQMAKTGG